jgi:hypothetical protein
MIPKDWKEDDYCFKWDKLYYGDKEIDLQVHEVECDYKRPSEIVEIADGEDYESEEFFDCQEPDSTAYTTAAEDARLTQIVNQMSINLSPKQT